MDITVLGTASIGGVPEWDCTCPNCSSARADSKLRRTRASITVSLDGGKHILIDAGHDLKTQLESRGLTPRKNMVDENFRESRLDSVFLTHGHADHTAGIAEFCTGKSFEIPVYASKDLIDFLFGTEDSPNYFGALGRLAKNYVIPFKLEENEIVTRLKDVHISGFEVKHTQVLEDGSKFPTSTYAYEFSDDDKRFIYAPDIGELDESLLDRLDGLDVFMMDATFWWDDELERISGIPVTSYELGHVPQREATRILEGLDIDRVIFTHFNHTNPVLNSESRYRDIIEAAGQELAYDGMIIEL